MTIIKMGGCLKFVFETALALLLATSAISVPVVIGRRKIGWTKFGSRKCHIAKYSTGVVVFSGNAYFVRNTIFGCVDKILSWSYNSYNGKNSK